MKYLILFGIMEIENEKIYLPNIKYSIKVLNFEKI